MSDEEIDCLSRDSQIKIAIRVVKQKKSNKKIKLLSKRTNTLSRKIDKLIEKSSIKKKGKIKSFLAGLGTGGGVILIILIIILL